MVRVRESGHKCSINYKNWHYDEKGKSNYCDEFESDVAEVEQVRKLLKALKFSSIAIVDKKRQLWKYKDYEIAIDVVTGLGDFIEIEYEGGQSSAKAESITDAMLDLLHKVGCTKIERNFQGYPFLILFPEETHFQLVSESRPGS